MWSDNETSVDYLGYGHLVQAITTLVSDKSLLPCTVGVFGDWGSGKTSLVRMASSQMTDAGEGIHVLDFDGWLFEGYDDARAALMETVIEAIASQQTASTQVKKLAVRLMRRVNWFRLAGSAIKCGTAFAVAGPAGLALSAGKELNDILGGLRESLDGVSADDIQKLLKEESEGAVRKHIQEFRSDFAALLNASKIDTLVVVIDDLDRCLPDTIIETLEAIKLFLFVPKTAFVIGADERLVRYAVRRRFPEIPGERAEVGRDYLEKLIQFSIRIPPLSASEMETFVALLFCEHHLDDGQMEAALTSATDPSRAITGNPFGLADVREILTKLPSELEEELLLAERISPMLAAGLSGNPRQCKRFMNTMMIRTQMAKSRGIQLTQRVLAKLMLLEYFRPTSFRELAELQAAQDGRPKEMAALEAHINGKAEKTASKKAGAKSRDTEEKKKPDDEIGRLQAWESDDWLTDWARRDPQLANEDLRPYFYFSRDTFGASGVSTQRLSPAAQEVLANLVHESESIRNAALTRGTGLNTAEAAGIFDALITAARRSENNAPQNSPLNMVVEFVQRRQELVTELVKAIADMPESTLVLATPLKLFRSTKGTPAESAAMELLSHWSSSAKNSDVKKAAAAALRRKGKAGSR